mmetsp:Transcript_5148/g.12092  ORF Transcript_5148/g.12092 Transcript_5148/m.12092 type:complete len:282 (+) Transcript_5148:251-1096(+)
MHQPPTKTPQNCTSDDLDSIRARTHTEQSAISRPIDSDDLPRHPAHIVAGDRHTQGPDLPRLADPLERRHLLHLVLEVLGKQSGQRGSWGNSIDPNALLAGFFCGTLGKHVDRRLGRTVAGHHGQGVAAKDAAIVDDDAALTHALDGLLHRKEDPLDIQIHEPVIEFLCGVFDVRLAPQSAVVEQNIHLPEARVHLIVESSDLTDAREVGLKDRPAPAGLLHSIERRLGLGLIACVVYGHDVALLGECDGSCIADTTTGSSHEHHTSRFGHDGPEGVLCDG